MPQWADRARLALGTSKRPMLYTIFQQRPNGSSVMVGQPLCREICRPRPEDLADGPALSVRERGSGLPNEDRRDSPFFFLIINTYTPA